MLGDKKLTFTYDYMGRRVEKVYWIYKAAGACGNESADWCEQSRRRFVYDNWNVILVLDGSNNVKTTYAWGLDLSGLAGNASVSGIHGAGGIGGLLAAVETGGMHAGTYWFTYDGNGNVGQVLNATTPTAIETAAYYEYDPYGNTLRSAGSYAAANPFRFSSKWLDSELAGWNIQGAIGNTGLYYYGYRYYSPRLGSWVSRDPIGERGGLNLLVFAVNNPVFQYDPLGQAIPAIAVGAAVAGALEEAAAVFGLSIASCLATPACREKAIELLKIALDKIGAAVGTCMKLRCNVHIDSPDHFFLMPRWGIPPWKTCWMSHLQINCYIKGVRNSNWFEKRIPYGPCFKYKNGVPPDTH